MLDDYDVYERFAFLLDTAGKLLRSATALEKAGRVEESLAAQREAVAAQREAHELLGQVVARHRRVVGGVPTPWLELYAHDERLDGSLPS